MKKIVIIGATSSIAEHCARIWVKDPVELVLVGRNQGKLDLISQDLQVRSPKSKITTKIANFEDPQAIETVVMELNPTEVDIVLIAHGSLPEQQECQNDLNLCKETLIINGVSPALFAEVFANGMAQSNKGTLAIISSVAGDRGRKSNYVYGAAKGLVTRYAQGLQHRLAKTNVKVVLVKPGPTYTPMTAHIKDVAKLAPVASVAKKIVDGVELGKPVIYAPGKWAFIMLVIRHLPNFLFKKLDI
jgi:decaprenylphospho-beta-D-erythro-pentofuranosid-2-ulose 2-reductase